jgi:hypothetical protein
MLGGSGLAGPKWWWRDRSHDEPIDFWNFFLCVENDGAHLELAGTKEPAVLFTKSVSYPATFGELPPDANYGQPSMQGSRETRNL